MKSYTKQTGNGTWHNWMQGSGKTGEFTLSIVMESLSRECNAERYVFSDAQASDYVVAGLYVASGLDGGPHNNLLIFTSKLHSNGGRIRITFGANCGPSIGEVGQKA